MRMIHHIDGTEIPCPRVFSSWYSRAIDTTAGRLTYDERIVTDAEDVTMYEYRRARVGDRIVSVDELERILGAVADLRRDAG